MVSKNRFHFSGLSPPDPAEQTKGGSAKGSLSDLPTVVVVSSAPGDDTDEHRDDGNCDINSLPDDRGIMRGAKILRQQILQEQSSAMFIVPTTIVDMDALKDKCSSPAEEDGRDKPKTSYRVPSSPSLAGDSQLLHFLTSFVTNDESNVDPLSDIHDLDSTREAADGVPSSSASMVEDAIEDAIEASRVRYDSDSIHVRYDNNIEVCMHGADLFHLDAEKQVPTTEAGRASAASLCVVTGGVDGDDISVLTEAAVPATSLREFIERTLATLKGEVNKREKLQQKNRNEDEPVALKDDPLMADLCFCVPDEVVAAIMSWYQSVMGTTPSSAQNKQTRAKITKKKNIPPQHNVLVAPNPQLSLRAMAMSSPRRLPLTPGGSIAMPTTPVSILKKTSSYVGKPVGRKRASKTIRQDTQKKTLEVPETTGTPPLSNRHKDAAAPPKKKIPLFTKKKFSFASIGTKKTIQSTPSIDTKSTESSRSTSRSRPHSILIEI